MSLRSKVFNIHEVRTRRVENVIVNVGIVDRLTMPDIEQLHSVVSLTRWRGRWVVEERIVVYIGILNGTLRPSSDIKVTLTLAQIAAIANIVRANVVANGVVECIDRIASEDRYAIGIIVMTIVVLEDVVLVGIIYIEPTSIPGWRMSIVGFVVLHCTILA